MALSNLANRASLGVFVEPKPYALAYAAVEKESRGFATSTPSFPSPLSRIQPSRASSTTSARRRTSSVDMSNHGVKRSAFSPPCTALSPARRHRSSRPPSPVTRTDGAQCTAARRPDPAARSRWDGYLF